MRRPPGTPKRTSLATNQANHDSAARDQAAAKILAARKRKAHELRMFRVPHLNWQAEHLTDMISWCGQITEPPVTKLMSYNVITSAWDRHLELPSLPRHSQCGKVRKVCYRGMPEYCDYENRHVLIVPRQAARKCRIRSNTKADYHK